MAFAGVTIIAARGPGVAFGAEESAHRGSPVEPAVFVELEASVDGTAYVIVVLQSARIQARASKEQRIGASGTYRTR